MLVLDFISLKFDEIWSIFEKVIHNNMKFFLQIFCHAYRIDHQCYDSEIFVRHLYAIKSGLF